MHNLILAAAFLTMVLAPCLAAILSTREPQRLPSRRPSSPTRR